LYCRQRMILVCTRLIIGNKSSHAKHNDIYNNKNVT
jgi:hypothetical protein